MIEDELCRRSLVSVLIVDDDPWVTKAVALALGSAPDLLIQEPVHTGSEAVEHYLSEHADVILMDINMPPGMNGIEAIAAIRTHDPEARIAVLTTIAPGPGLARALDAGAMAVVSKSASEQTLIEVVRTIAHEDDPRLLRGLAEDVILSDRGFHRDQPSPPRLTRAELGVLRLICQGLSYEEIASEQCVSPWTVKAQTRALREKLRAENLAQLVVRAIDHRFFSV